MRERRSQFRPRRPKQMKNDVTWLASRKETHLDSRPISHRTDTHLTNSFLWLLVYFADRQTPRVTTPSCWRELILVLSSRGTTTRHLRQWYRHQHSALRVISVASCRFVYCHRQWCPTFVSERTVENYWEKQAKQGPRFVPAAEYWTRC